MFLGTYTPKLDDKGRLTLPAKFREELAGGLMVTKGQDHSLAVYPREEFAARVRKAAAVSRTNPQAPFPLSLRHFYNIFRMLGSVGQEYQIMVFDPAVTVTHDDIGRLGDCFFAISRQIPERTGDD